MKIKTIVVPLVLAFAAANLSGCVSVNAKAYQPDILTVNQLKSSLKNNVSVGTVKLEQGDTNKILCRLAGDVYLPDKMTYSQYIKQAFEEQLLAANKLADKSSDKALNVDLKAVDFSTVEGSWTISANISVNDNSPIFIKSVYDFGTSFVAYAACKSAGQAFEGAVAHFINQVLTNSSILKELNSQS